MKEIKIETIVLWHEHKIVGVHVNGDIVWEKFDVAMKETDLIETKIDLPIVETIEYAATLLNGIAAERLVILLDILEKKLVTMQLLCAELDLRAAASALKDDLSGHEGDTKNEYCDGKCRDCQDYTTICTGKDEINDCADYEHDEDDTENMMYENFDNDEEWDDEDE